MSFASWHRSGVPYRFAWLEKRGDGNSKVEWVYKVTRGDVKLGKRQLAHWYAVEKLFDVEISSNNTDSAAGIPVKFLLSLEGFLKLWIYGCYVKKAASSQKNVEIPDMFIRCLKIFIQLFEFFTSQKSPWIHIWLARAGRFPWIEILAGLKEKGDLEVSGWGGLIGESFRFGCRLFVPKKLLRIILSQLLKSWKERMKAWREYESCSNIYPLRKLTCRMKSSGWTTFDPLFRGHALVLGWKKVALRRAQDAASAIDLGNAVTWVPSPTAPRSSHGHRWQTRGGFETNNFPGIWVFFWLGCAC